MRAACALATSKWEWNAGIGSAVSVLNVQLLGVIRKRVGQPVCQGLLRRLTQGRGSSAISR